MNPLIWSLLITGLATSTIITMSSNHWVLAWVGLELNTLSILPIIMNRRHPRATEATTKYFLIQAMAAALILFASTMNAWKTGQWSIMNTTQPSTTMITLALMFKLGLTPMHAWYPEVVQGSTMNTALIISTWQKMAPLTLLYLMHNNLPMNIMLMLGLMSALIGGWTAINQTQTRKIMALSSVAHMGWLMIALNMNLNISTLTLLTYIMLTTTMFMSLNLLMMKTLTDAGTAWSQSPVMTTMMMITLMSLGGLPPLTGFIPKWLILTNLCYMKLAIMSIMMALASLPSLFFYVRMAYLITLTTPPNTTSTQHKWRFKINTTQILLLTTMMSTLMLPLTPMITTM
uniref:NADH-ubiquinone oxidoreductase chain 2 n=1 Tax=Gekko vittatus TaxID=278186 RepID=A1IGQ0_9SAUR|nr:NADH dehydrogenase subunit 2 [Gekko vittatus]BAF44019.1 NADH dehydrogenase subunit 2 [Gekko vittatus]